MIFEWDFEKEKINQEKHGIFFQEAALVFSDPEAIYLIDPDHSEDEERMIALGRIENILIAVVIFIDKSMNNEECIRIISARRATKNEEIQYFSKEIL